MKEHIYNGMKLKTGLAMNTEIHSGSTFLITVTMTVTNTQGGHATNQRSKFKTHDLINIIYDN